MQRIRGEVSAQLLSVIISKGQLAFDVSVKKLSANVLSTVQPHTTERAFHQTLNVFFKKLFASWMLLTGDVFH